MWEDPIVNEVRRIRDWYAARFTYDLDRIYAELKEQEKKSGRHYESYSPRTAKPTAVSSEET